MGVENTLRGRNVPDFFSEYALIVNYTTCHVVSRFGSQPIPTLESASGVAVALRGSAPHFLKSKPVRRGRRGPLIWRVFLRRASFYQISTTNRVVSVRVTGTRTPDLARAQQPFPLDHWQFWDKVLTSFSKTYLSVVKPTVTYSRRH